MTEAINEKTVSVHQSTLNTPVKPSELLDIMNDVRDNLISPTSRFYRVVKAVLPESKWTELRDLALDLNRIMSSYLVNVNTRMGKMYFPNVEYFLVQYQKIAERVDRGTIVQDAVKETARDIGNEFIESLQQCVDKNLESGKKLDVKPPQLTRARTIG